MNFENRGDLSSPEGEGSILGMESEVAAVATQNVTSNSDSNKSVDNAQDEDVIQTAEGEIMDLEEQELHDVTISSYFNRVGCFALTIQLVARKFDTFSSVKKVLGKVRHLVAKFNRSSRATEKMINTAGKKLVADCPTRWSSTFVVVSPLLELRIHASAVCAEFSGISIAGAKNSCVSGMCGV